MVTIRREARDGRGGVGVLDCQIMQDNKTFGIEGKSRQKLTTRWRLKLELYIQSRYTLPSPSDSLWTVSTT